MKLTSVVIFFLLCCCFSCLAVLSKGQTLHFYMHDVVGTSDATALMVVPPANQLQPGQFMGAISVIDDKLTEGPSPDSKEIGRAQGTYMADSFSQLSLLMTFAAVLPNGTLSFHGQDPPFQPTRELAIVGGTGTYRFASGYATIRTQSSSGSSAVLDVRVFLKASSS